MRILFMGTPDFAVPCLKSLVEAEYQVIGVVTQPDRPKGRKQALTPPPVKIAALQYGIPVYQPEKLSDPKEMEIFRSMEIDLVVTAAFGQLLPKEFLELPLLGCINVHASLLPKYRGGAPIHWSVINGETETGVTIMYMAEKLDAGDIISQKRVTIEDADTTGDVYRKVTEAGATLLMETLPEIMAGAIQPIPQNHQEATFAYNIQRSDEFIKWERSAKEIYNQIRGLAPWPGAYTTSNGQILKIWASELWNMDTIDKELLQTSPGTVIELIKQGPLINTGNGVLLLKEVQPEGKKSISGQDYVNSGKIDVRSVLGR